MILDEQKRLFYRKLCLADYWYFVKIVGGYVKQGYIATEHIHRPLFIFSTDTSKKRRVILTPRDWIKSVTLTKLRAIWSYLKNNESRILIGAETEILASRILISIEEMILQNDMLRVLFPELSVVNKTWTNKNKWSGRECMLPRKGLYTDPTFFAAGAGAAIQGIHPNEVFLDDIVGKKARDSAAVLEDTMRWFDNIKELCENPNHLDVNGSPIQVVGTRWGNGDIYDYIADSYPEYEFRIVPALKASDEKITQAMRGRSNMVFVQHPDVDIGESNWPESQKFTTEYYRAMLANPAQESVAHSQHMNMPQMSSASNPLKYDWLNFFHFEDEGEESWLICDDHPNDPNKNERFPLTYVPLYMVIDPGGFATTGAVKRGSRVAFVIAGQPTSSHKKFVVETYSRRVMVPSEFFQAVIAAYRKWRPRTISIETIASQEYIYKDVYEQSQKLGVRLPLLRIEKDASSLQDKAKFRRICQLSTPGANGDIYLLKSMKDLIAEWTNFDENSVMPNDILDCLAWINQRNWSGLPKGNILDLNKQKESEWLSRRGVAT